MSRQWRGWIVPLATVVAFGFSLQGMWDLALSNSPTGLVAFVPLGTLILIWGRLRVPPDRQPEGRDLFFDSVTAAIPLTVALILIIVLPTRLSLIYWLYRIDLLAVPLFVVGLITIAWGFWALRRIWPALAYLLLISPLPFIWFQQWFGNAFVDISIWGSGGLIGLSGLPIQLDPLDGQTFFSDEAGREFEVLIGQVCSGTNLTLGFLLVGGPVMSRFMGSLRRKIAWLAAGALLTIGLNMVRVFALIAGLYTLDQDFVFDVLHPLLGAGMFLALFVGMLAVAGRFGLRFGRPDQAVGEWIWHASTPHIGRRALGVIAGLTLLLAVFGTSLADVAWVRNDRLPVLEIESVETFLPAPENWTLEYDGRLLWGAYFGRGSRADTYVYHSESIPDVEVQAVFARTLGQLNTYSLESCDLFHGHAILGSRQIALGRGITGTIVRTFYEDGPIVTLYWTIPVMLDGDVLHARIALFLDDELPVPPVPPSTVDASFLTVATTALNSKLGKFVEPAPDQTLDRIEGHLARLGSQIVAELTR